MNGDSSGKPTPPSFLDRIRKQSVVHFQQAQDSFSQQYPEAAQRLRVTQQRFRAFQAEKREAVMRSFDGGVQSLALKGMEHLREATRIETPPDAWMHTRIRNKAINFASGKVFDNSEMIVKGASHFLSGVSDRVVPGTKDRYDPRHIATLFTHPEMTRRYFQQRKTQFMQPLELYRDPSAFASRKKDQFRQSFGNYKDRYFEMDGGLFDKTKHGGRVVVDSLQDKIAPAIGFGMLAFGLFNRRAQRQATNQALDRIAPKGTIRSPLLRNPATKFLMTKPIARVMGNPRLALGIIGFSVLTGMGKSIRDSMALQQRLPDTHRRLTASGRDVIGASSQLDLHESIGRTKRKF